MKVPGGRQTLLLKALGSVSRLRILLALWKLGGEVTVYRICRFTGLGRGRVTYHLKILVESGLVRKRSYASISLYALNRESEEAAAVAELFRRLRL